MLGLTVKVCASVPLLEGVSVERREALMLSEAEWNGVPVPKV
jgi:hypothetical protein